MNNNNFQAEIDSAIAHLESAIESAESDVVRAELANNITDITNSAAKEVGPSYFTPDN